MVKHNSPFEVGVVRALLSAGASMREKDRDGKTAMDLAEGIPDAADKAVIVRLLAQAGAR